MRWPADPTSRPPGRRLLARGPSLERIQWRRRPESGARAGPGAARRQAASPIGPLTRPSAPPPSLTREAFARPGQPVHARGAGRLRRFPPAAILSVRRRGLPFGLEPGGSFGLKRRPFAGSWRTIRQPLRGGVAAVRPADVQPPDARLTRQAAAVASGLGGGTADGRRRCGLLTPGCTTADGPSWGLAGGWGRTGRRFWPPRRCCRRGGERCLPACAPPLHACWSVASVAHRRVSAPATL